MKKLLPIHNILLLQCLLQLLVLNNQTSSLQLYTTAFVIQNNKKHNYQCTQQKRRVDVAVDLVTCTSPLTLFMGAFNKRNKQADLMAKMKAAKQSQQPVSSSLNSKLKKTREEIKEENDRKRFEELLNRQSAMMDGEGSSSVNYRTLAQEEEEASAGFRGVDRLFEGDDAPTDVFFDLVKPSLEFQTLGEAGAKRIVPWLGAANHPKEYLIVITDPRSKSTELRRVLKSIQGSSIPSLIKKRMIVVTSDSSRDNYKYMKNNAIEDIEIYSDEKREFMRQYTALGEQRWAICMFIIADGVVQRIVRELDPDFAEDVVQKAVNSLNL